MRVVPRCEYNPRVGRLRRIRKSSALLAAIVVGLVSSPARPCLQRPRNLVRPHAQIVDQARQIFLAVATGSRPTAGIPFVEKPVVYSLRVTRVLKGQVGQAIEAPARGFLRVGQTIEMPGDGDRAFDPKMSDHADEDFWKRAAGRMSVMPNCVMAPPTFAVGHQYLILIGDPDDSKDLERVESDSDKWLVFVANRIAAAK